MLYLKASNKHPLKYILSGNLVNGDSFVHTSRCLDYFVLLVGLEGTLYISQDGMQYTLNPGQIMLLPPGHHHGGYRESEGMLSYFWYHFYAPDDAQLLDEAGISEYLQNLNMSGVQRDIYLLPEHGTFTNASRITLECRQVMDYSLQNPYSSSIVDYALSLLAMDLTQECLQQNEQQIKQNNSYCRMVDIQEYVRNNYLSTLSVPRLAEIFGYNANYLSTVYKKATGVSLVHFINQTRIAAAKTLLLDTHDSITSIAPQVGYSDSKYFIRIFRQFEGTTPVMFRNIYFRKHINRS
ncbi:MAG: AraC family transcriptional regulator [Eubacteriales bacterium]|nr:AraC family transcriptional regulator [Eubacteriales bacterium]